MTIAVPIAEPQQHRSLRADTLADSVTIMFALTAVQRMVGFGRSMLFCFCLDPQELGQWDIAFGFLMLAAPVAVLSLPGSFGRYVQYYRHRGQLRTFLRRTLCATIALASLSATIVWLRGNWFSELIFGRSDQTDFIGLLTFTLLAIIAFNFVSELFTALRMQRVASSLEFLNSALFAIFGVGLIYFWQRSAASVVLAYGLACLVSTGACLIYVRSRWKIPKSESPIPHSAFWVKLIPFVASVWIINWLGNLFGIVDRYMILHYSEVSSADALGLVGQYHSSRLVPAMLITVTGLLAGILLPYLSHEWETAGRESVSARLNLALKLTCVLLCCAAVTVQAVGPWMYHFAFSGKYDGGLAVLPWTLTSSVWFGMLCVAKLYLWCDERVRLVSLSYAIGLLVMVSTDLLLLPPLGLLGAVLGTCLANFAALSAVYGFSRWRGMHLHTGTLLISALPLSLTLGNWGAALAVLAASVFLSAYTNVFFTQNERAELFSVLRRYSEIARRRFGNVTVAAAELERLPFHDQGASHA